MKLLTVIGIIWFFWGCAPIPQKNLASPTIHIISNLNGITFFISESYEERTCGETLQKSKFENDSLQIIPKTYEWQFYKMIIVPQDYSNTVYLCASGSGNENIYIEPITILHSSPNTLYLKCEKHDSIPLAFQCIRIEE